ncbi:MAG TPA: ABC transporter substrate-binding protein [Accumulibacter sp.]|uniref:ABC transporter substrate-binding protein n=1 Tax=Accumulibacter sp. TaxID=2053492 RepID=UPI0026181D7C|nr:ABC transporter substrate-binding protein [Accumulibacter sp.]HMV06045.1 ABC transporter substrate-binding protein [Accumulibacter sp.]HMW64412.1 ABC transporter substrate-binding protein [Accumulibacter sp.]HMW80577.1 ABC transporter substrate-binding protein [Accumulibacter sp.]HNC27881.1 ABC transporter substrate-binding protein [Accumulibacter sp.]HND40019.1 ABC transporter substrate-binding protein [Accumulibacter sp.]
MRVKLWRSVLVGCCLASSAFAAEEIVLGQTVALSGPMAEHGKAIQAGARAYFSRINADGGVHGRRIVLKSLDDGGDANRAAENTARLIDQERVLAVFAGAEGGPCIASMKVAIERKTPLVACLAGAAEFRESYNRYVFPVRAGHQLEFERLVDTAAQFGQFRMAFLHSDSETGRKHLANVRKALARHQLDLTKAIVLPAKPDAEAIARELREAKVDVAFNHGSYAAFAAVITASRKLGAATRFMAVNSGAQQMVRLLAGEAQGLVFTQVVPFPWGVAPPVVREYQRDLQAVDAAADFSFSSLEGYLSARVLVAGLQQAGAATPNREALVNGLEKLGQYDLGGYAVSYSPRQHLGSSFVDTVIATRDGRFVH